MPKPTSQAQKPDGDIHPLMQLVFIDAPHPPQRFEVEVRLKAAGLEPAPADALEAKGLIWSAAWKLGRREVPVRVFVADRDRQFAPWRTTEVLWGSREELERAQKSRWIIGVESIQAEAACDFLHLLLRVADAAGGDEACAVADDLSTRVRSATVMRELARCPVAPGPNDLYTIHFIANDDGTCWAHTHGLRAYNAPDLEMFGLKDDHAGPGHGIISAVAARLVEEEIPVEGAEMAFGDELVAQLRPVMETLRPFPASLGGGSGDHDESHSGWRLAILDADAPWPPKKAANLNSLAPAGLLHKMQDHAIVWFSNRESNRQAALARLRFPEAALAHASANPQRRKLLVKLAIPADEARSDYSSSLQSGQTPPKANNEHMWFEVKGFSQGLIEGQLLNRPNYATYLKEGQRCKVSAERVSGFDLWIESGRFGPETVMGAGQPRLRTDWTDFDKRS